MVKTSWKCGWLFSMLASLVTRAGTRLDANRYYDHYCRPDEDILDSNGFLVSDICLNFLAEVTQ